MLKKSSIVGAAVMLFAMPAIAADVKSEVVNAETHASLAAKATDIDTVHMHLHHVLNCLAGPDHPGFDAKQMNPCAHSGDGAIPDTADATKKASLQTAANKAVGGITETNLAAAQKDASDIAMMLKGDE